MSGIKKRLFIDYENVTNLSGIDLNSYEKVYLFLGAKQTKVDISKFPNQRVVELNILKIDTIGKDSLDMHIVYYLGVYDFQLPKEIEFDVLSNDKGYDNILKYIHDSGRKTKRISFKRTEVTPPVTPVTTTTERPKKVNKEAVKKPKPNKKLNALDEGVVRVQNREKGKPNSFSALKNTLKSQKFNFTENDLFSSLRKLEIAVDDRGTIKW